MQNWNESIDENTSFTFFYLFIFFSDNNQQELEYGSNWNKSVDENASFTFFYSFIFFSDNNQPELECKTGMKALTRMHHSLFSVHLFSSQTTISPIFSRRILMSRSLMSGSGDYYCFVG